MCPMSPFLDVIDCLSSNPPSPRKRDSIDCRELVQEPFDDSNVPLIEDGIAGSRALLHSIVDVSLNVLGTCAVPEVVGSIVIAVPIKMHDLREWWTRAEEGFGYDTMNGVCRGSLGLGFVSAVEADVPILVSTSGEYPASSQRSHSAVRTDLVVWETDDGAPLFGKV